MKKKIKEFKEFVAEQLKSFDDFREASSDGYIDDITDMAVKLFTTSNVIPSLPNCKRCNRKMKLKKFYECECGMIDKEFN